jgi:hypothetical protein
MFKVMLETFVAKSPHRKPHPIRFSVSTARDGTFSLLSDHCLVCPTRLGLMVPYLPSICSFDPRKIPVPIQTALVYLFLTYFLSTLTDHRFFAVVFGSI